MKRIKLFEYFTPFEWGLWLSSVVAIALSFFLFGNREYHYLVGTIVGITGLIFMAKGNPVGHAVLIAFSLFYGAVSYSYRYYGEMVTFLGMNLPGSVLALVSWLRHPHEGNHAEVRVNRLKKREYLLAFLGSVVLSVPFYFILRALDTNNLLLSTFSVLTSVYACYLMTRRSKFYALAFVSNDLVLVGLWTLAAIESVSYVPMALCFIAFFLFDGYGFISWARMEKKQRTK